jgi:hypothetical protein
MDPTPAGPCASEGEQVRHCLWLSTRPPNPHRARLVARRLQKDGYQALADGDRIIVQATLVELEKLMGVRPTLEHSTDRADPSGCRAVLPASARLSFLYRGDVGEEVLLDDPACAL